MQRISLLLLGMASLVASGVIVDRGRVSLNAMGGSGLQTVQGIRDGGVGGSGSGSGSGGGGGGNGGNVLSKDELLRQKFVLEILNQVYTPLQQQELLALNDPSIVTNENLYMRPLTQEMALMLDLISSNQVLGKQTVVNIGNKHHQQQIVGLYRLLVTARDFDAFKHLVVYARQNINTEMFVHSLIIALGERHDTNMLIVPALYEILPQLYIQDNVIDQVHQLDTGVSSVKPQFMDVMGVGNRNSLWNPFSSDQQQGGLLSVLNKSQLWMPWRELNRQMALRKMMGRNVVLQQQQQQQMDKLVISLPGNGLLSQDIGLKSYVTILVSELLVNQDTVKNANQNNFDIGGLGGRGQTNLYGINGISRNRVDNDWNINSQQGNILGGQQFNTAQGGINANRLLHVGRHNRDSDLSSTNEFNRNINDDQQYGTNINGASGFGKFRDENDLLIGGSRHKNYLNLNDEFDTNRNIYMRSGNVHQGQGKHGFNTVSANDARLLFVGRRNKNPNNVVNMGSSYYDEDDWISGGRHVSNERSNGNKHHQSKYNKKYNSNNNNDDVGDDDHGDDENEYTLYDITRMNNEQYSNYNSASGRGQVIENDEDDEGLWSNKNRNIGSNANYRDSWQHQQTNDYVNRNSYSQGSGLGIGMGHGRDDFYNIVTRGNTGQRHYFDNDQDLMLNSGWSGQQNAGPLDTHLPTTSINDERLLHINRHKLHNYEEGGYSNFAGDRFYDDNDRYNTGYQRSNINKQHSRSRRSIVNQGLSQSNTNANAINGKLVLHNLQQLVARLNVERIALGQPQLIDDSQNNIVRGYQGNSFVGHNGIQGVDAQTVSLIQDIIQDVDQVLQNQIGHISVSSYNQKVNEIGLMLAGKIQEIGLVNTLSEVLQQTYPQQRKGQVASLLENQAAQVLLAGIVKVIDNKVQQVFRQREQFISTVQGVNINNVEVDKLQTYLEQASIDLTNLLSDNGNIEQTIQGNKKVVVGRVPRLNHKSFSIKIDVTSDRQQQVVVRNLLVPKVDGNNNIIPLVLRRQNVIVLDITTAQLQQGHNTLKLHSNDITITSRDTTPLTKIYQIVMNALNNNGDNVLQQNILAGQSTLLPHRLLLPRGRANGLPMQLITVITPLQGSAGILGINQGTGLNSLSLDNLPLNYPLHCDITDLDKVNSMPNLIVTNLKIYHDDNI